MLSQLPHPAIFAHRGSSAHAPENTLAAFQLAVRQGADAIELDAKLSADGHVVVIHDHTVDRTTDGSGSVRELPLAALQDLDAGSHFDIAFQGEKIPTLEEVFETIGKDIYINVELTNYTSRTDDLPQKVAALVKQFGLTERVLFSSFDLFVLFRVKRIIPDVPLGLLTLPGLGGILARSGVRHLIQHVSFHPNISDATISLIKYVQKSGRRVYVYTVNQSKDIQNMFAMGVDGIFTDDPLLARQILSGTDRLL